MMYENVLTMILALIPLGLGMAVKGLGNTLGNVRTIGLAALGVLGGGLVYMGFAFGLDSSIMLLAGAALFSAFCAFLGQQQTGQSSKNQASIMTLLGFGLGVLLHPGILGRVFLVGLLVHLAVSLHREKPGSYRKTIILSQIGLAVILAAVSSFGGTGWSVYASLFLAVIFLPLVPFHFPFVGAIESAEGTLSSFLVVVLLAIGLGELNKVHSSLTDGMLFVVSLLAIVSAVYASLASLGQQKSNLFVASATVAHVSLVWGLLNVFASFPKWGIPLGTTIALVMSGIGLAFSFVRQRYGWQALGKLPGLASPMPRFGIAMVFLVSFAVILPLFSTVSGLMFLPVGAENGVIVMVLFTFFAVWLGGTWYFSQMLHQTTFGAARLDVPYTDLRTTEIIAVWGLLLFGIYSGLIH